MEVTATRELAVAWEHEVRRVASRSTDVTGVARVLELLDESVGAPVLGMLEGVLADADGWDQVDDDTYRHELDGGYVAYHADTRELEIVAHATDSVTVEATETELLHGEVRGPVEGRGEGRYYDDGWGGVTEHDARQEALRHAEAAVDTRAGELVTSARLTAEADRAAALEASATAKAEADLAHRAGVRTEELRADAARALTAVGIQGRTAFHQVLAQAYRAAILAYARMRGAEGVSCTETDGVLEIEFELRA